MTRVTIERILVTNVAGDGMVIRSAGGHTLVQDCIVSGAGGNGFVFEAVPPLPKTEIELEQLVAELKRQIAASPDSIKADATAIVTSIESSPTDENLNRALRALYNLSLGVASSGLFEFLKRTLS